MNPPLITIYALINPINDYVFYVGASNKPTQRRPAHNTGAGTKEKLDTISIIFENAHKIEFLELEQCELSKASFWEDFYIDLFSSFGFKLTNKSRKSSYSSAFKNHEFTSLSKSYTFSVKKEFFNDLTKIRSKYRFSLNFFIRMAIDEAIEKYTDKYEDAINNKSDKYAFSHVIKRMQEKHHKYKYYD